MSNEHNGSARWKLVADPDNPGCWLWEWDANGADDLDALFDRIREGTATPVDSEQFDACMMDRFSSAAYAGETMEPWIMRALADRFTQVLAGGEWCDAFPMPGRPTTPIRPWREQRDLEIYCVVENAHRDGYLVTDAITLAADEAAVSFPTARAAYYRWRALVSKKASEV
jgi:hypothetical protein